MTASARVGDRVRTVQGVVTKNPPSKVFDYEYFLNNWGWWWGNTITGNGGNRANWDFDFQYYPVVNGEILATGGVKQNLVPVDPFNGTPPFHGMAGNDPVDLVHSGVPRLTMPNLRDFTYYQNKALADTTTNGIWISGQQIVAGVWTNSSKPGIYLVGTAAAPIVMSNTVVVNGDVIIKGKITGRGTLYVGGNLYIANDLSMPMDRIGARHQKRCHRVARSVGGKQPRQRSNRVWCPRQHSGGRCHFRRLEGLVLRPGLVGTERRRR